MSFVVGILGGLLVVALVFSGAWIGWTARSYFEERIEEKAEALRPVSPMPALTDEQITELKEDQEAFSTMLHYSPEIAYGLKTDPLQSLMRKKE